MNTQDPETIVALATADGEGAIAVIRISGPRSHQLLAAVFQPLGSPEAGLAPFRLYPGHLQDEGEKIDEVMAVVMRGPKSYTGEDMAEIHSHGGRAVAAAALDLLVRRGGRLAEAGEFTRRAFLNGKMDLTRAESVAWMISARSRRELKCATDQISGGLRDRLLAVKRGLIRGLALIEVTLDFDEYEEVALPYPEVEDILRPIRRELARLEEEARTGGYLRHGLRVAIVGKPNVGKSSILNAFLSRNRAIVSPRPGTTRDTIEEEVILDGIPLQLIDTAGLRRPRTEIEEEGVSRARQNLAEADLVLLVLDSGSRISSNDREVIHLARQKRALIVVNKTDLPPRADLDRLRREFKQRKVVKISALNNQGMDELREEIVSLLRQEYLAEGGCGVLISGRRRQALEEAGGALDRALAGLAERLSGELIALDLQGTLNQVKLVLGEEFSDEVLDEIFSRFCVGK